MQIEALFYIEYSFEAIYTILTKKTIQSMIFSTQNHPQSSMIHWFMMKIAKTLISAPPRISAPLE